MMRVVVLGQPGAFGSISCRHTAVRLARRLELPLVPLSDVVSGPTRAVGWVATATAGALNQALLSAADTVIWLHYSPAAVIRAWTRGLRARMSRAKLAGRAPRLSDIRDSLLHMVRTPHLHQLICQHEFAHLQVFCLCNPDQTDFWLRAQEHRLHHRRREAVAQAA